MEMQLDQLEEKSVRGRPREFCTEFALAAALRVFWSKGYEGASLTDLTEAMGITRPSLYAAFGNKEALFRKALDLYESEKLAYFGSAMGEPTARAVAERLLRGALDTITGEGTPSGCIAVITSVACGEEAEAIRDEVLKRAESSKKLIRERFERAAQEGDFPPGTDAATMGRYLLTVMQGMAVQASQGAKRDDLAQVVETTLLMWPGR